MLASNETSIFSLAAKAVVDDIMYVDDFLVSVKDVEIYLMEWLNYVEPVVSP